MGEKFALDNSSSIEEDDFHLPKLLDFREDLLQLGDICNVY
jgi:hypothetical protein